MKVTARIDDDICMRVVGKMHYGQQTALMRAIFNGLDHILQTQGMEPIAKFISQTASLTLDPTEVPNAPYGKNKG